MQTLDNRLNKIIINLENEYGIELSNEQKKQLKENKVVGYSKNNTFDKIVDEVSNEIKKIYLEHKMKAS